METGQDWFDVRGFDARIGRFVRVDPIADSTALLGWSPYHYAFDNPLRFRDESGKFPWIVVGLAAWMATRFESDLPGGSPSLPEIAAVGGVALGAGPAIGWMLSHPATTTAVTTGVAEAMLPGAETLTPGGVAAKGAMEVVETTGKTMLKAVAKEGAERFTQGQLKSFERQLAEHGVESLLKSRTTFEKRLSQHLKDLEKYKEAGGFTSKTETEIQNFQQQINAIINDILMRQP